jgi:hypothetical protein
MPNNLEKVVAAIRQPWHWLKNQWISDVPQNIAVCEFDCREDHCAQGDWSSCERRLSQAAGELRPAPPNSPTK